MFLYFSYIHLFSFLSFRFRLSSETHILHHDVLMWRFYSVALNHICDL